MDVGVQLVLRQAGFERPLMPLGTGLTYIVDLEKSLPELRENLEKNWRHQLVTAEKAGPEFSIGRDRSLLERYLPLHNELCIRKGLPGQRLTLAALEEMVEKLGDQIIFIIVSAQGRDGCGGAVWTFGDRSCFALSSANDFGLKLHLPNAFFWRAISHAKEKGSRQLDLAGIDPKDNWGVFNFKRGLKAKPVESLGEWEWSASPWLRRAFNGALWLKQDSLK
jgi:lipid II:glycine glycyltransferase (peptidoglycan interpeptide bridge formation enzyme)